MDLAAFRTNFPEFASTTVYTEAMLTFWLTVAQVYVSETKWEDVYNTGLSLALAHFLTIAKNNIEGEPGESSGMINSRSVGDVSYSVDTAATLEENAGQWNLTSYGQQFIRLARMISGCAIQIL